MARNFRRNRAAASHPIADLNVTNLIDLGFMLLIIFMVAAPLMKDEQTIQVNLPTEAKSPQATPDPALRTESITIDSRGGYYLGGAPISFGDLQTRIAGFAAEPKPPVIRVRPDKGGLVDNFVQVIAELKKYDTLGKLAIGTEAAN